MIKKCANPRCKQEFDTAHGLINYCCKSCKDTHEWFRKRKVINCKNCDTPLQRGVRAFCSDGCRQEWAYKKRIEYYQKNREKILRQQKANRQKQMEKDPDYFKRYYRENRAHILELVKKAKNKESRLDEKARREMEKVLKMRAFTTSDILHAPTEKSFQMIDDVLHDRAICVGSVS